MERKQSGEDPEQWTLPAEQRVCLLVLVLVCFRLGFVFVFFPFVFGRLVSWLVGFYCWREGQRLGAQILESTRELFL